MKKISVWEYDTTEPNAFSLKKGEEMGHFKLGSTVVVCLENGNFGDFLKTVQPGMKTQMGTAFGYSVKKWFKIRPQYHFIHKKIQI